MYNEDKVNQNRLRIWRHRGGVEI